MTSKGISRAWLLRVAIYVIRLEAFAQLHTTQQNANCLPGSRGRSREGRVDPLRGQNEVVCLVWQHCLSLSLGKGGVQVLVLPPGPLTFPANFPPRAPA